jgi:ubiquinone/menaquinone biosynthesis C-methylase UbiE
MSNKDEIQARITGFWSTVASGYEAHGGNVPARDSAEYRLWVEAVARLLPEPPSRVLDLATGTGFVALIAAGLGHEIAAIDLAEPMLAEARKTAAQKNLSISFATGDVVAPAFAARSFDAVINRHLFWTLRDPEAALSAWRRLLKPGGRAIVIDGFWFKPVPDDSPEEEGLFGEHYSRDTRRALPGWQYFDPKPVVTMFEHAGFKRVTVETLDAIHRVAQNPPGETPSYVVTGFAE